MLWFRIYWIRWRTCLVLVQVYAGCWNVWQICLFFGVSLKTQEVFWRYQTIFLIKNFVSESDNVMKLVIEMILAQMKRLTTLTFMPSDKQTRTNKRTTKVMMYPALSSVEEKPAWKMKMKDRKPFLIWVVWSICCLLFFHHFLLGWSS